MLLQDLQKPKWKESSFSKEKIKTSMPVEFTPRQMDARIPSGVLPATETKGNLKLIVNLIQTLVYNV